MPFVETDDGGRIHYTVQGEGPPVLLLQGVGVAAHGWQPQVDGLSDRYRLVAVDNRGIGQSEPGDAPLTIERMVADAEAVLDHAGTGPAHLAAHSMGGLIALGLALQCRPRVRSLALLCSFANGRAVASPRPWVVWIGLRTRIGTRAMRRRAFVEMVTPASALPTADLDALAEQIGGVFGRDLAEQPSAAMKQFRAMSRHDVTARLGELAGMPTLVASADEDRLAWPALGKAVADGIDGARYHEFSASSHAVTIQRADEVNVLLAEHLSSVGRG